jgi:hypothetical protein
LFLKLSYPVRLSKLNLSTLVYRRNRGDAILAFKLLRANILSALSPIVSTNSRTRGHQLKLVEQSTTSIVAYINIGAQLRFAHKNQNTFCARKKTKQLYSCSHQIAWTKIIIFVRNEFYPHPLIYQFKVYICTLGGMGVNSVSDVNEMEV